MEKRSIFDEVAIKKFVDELTRDEIYQILNVLPRAQLLEWQDVLDGSRDTLILGRIKGLLIESGVRVTPKVLESDEATLYFVYLFTERIASRK